MPLRSEPVSYEALHTLHYAEVLRLCRLLLANHQDAEEVAQEVFLKAFQKQQSMNPTEPIFWMPWLVRVSINACRDRRQSGWWKWWHSGSSAEYQEANYSSATRSPEQALLGSQPTLATGMIVATFGLLSPRLLNALNLTPEQVTKIEASKKAFREAQRAYLTELTPIRKEVADKLFGPNPVRETDVAPQITKIADLREKILQEGFRIALDVRQALRPDQLAKAAAIRQQLIEIQSEVRTLYNENQ
jgi:DNA-directed RNA polymerase specialized sigma24 family protein